MSEIKKDGEIIIDKDGKKWMPVVVSYDALVMINKTVLGDSIDEDDKKRKTLEKQVHEDCLELFNEFKK